MTQVLRTDEDKVSLTPRLCLASLGLLPRCVPARKQPLGCGLFYRPGKPWSLRSVIVSGLIPARRAASSSVNPMAIASAILATTSGVRLVGRPSPNLPRLLMLCAGSLSMPSCHFSFFVRRGNSFRLMSGMPFLGPYKPPRAFDPLQGGGEGAAALQSEGLRFRGLLNCLLGSSAFSTPALQRSVL